MAPLPQRASLVNHPPITPPCQDPIFSTIIPVGYIRKSPPQGSNLSGLAAVGDGVQTGVDQKLSIFE